jgi:fused-like protein
MESLPDQTKTDLLSGPNGSGLGDVIMAFLLNLSSKTEMSPKGFISLLSFIHDVINSDSKPFMQKIFKNCLKLLCSLVRENQLLAI